MEINHIGLGLEMQHFYEYDKLCVYTLQQSNSPKNMILCILIMNFLIKNNLIFLEIIL